MKRKTRRTRPFGLLLCVAVLISSLALSSCSRLASLPEEQTDTQPAETHAARTVKNIPDDTPVPCTSLEPLAKSIAGPLMLVRWGKISYKPKRVAYLFSYLKEDGTPYTYEENGSTYEKMSAFALPYYRVEVEVLRIYYDPPINMLRNFKNTDKGLADITYLYIPAPDLYRIEENGYALVWNPMGESSGEKLTYLPCGYRCGNSFQSASFLPVKEGKIVYQNIECRFFDGEGNNTFWCIEEFTRWYHRAHPDAPYLHDGMPLEEFEDYFKNVYQ